MFVLDIGALYVSAAVVQVEGGVVKTLALSGDSGAGGLAFDFRLFNKASEEIKTKLRKHPKDDPRALNRLLLACEKAKNDLSASQRCFMDLDGLFDEEHFQGVAERSTFNEIAGDVCNVIRGIVESVLLRATIIKNNFTCQNKIMAIDEVFLVGGASRIPILREILEGYFQKPVSRQMDIDESVAHGAGKNWFILVNFLICICGYNQHKL